jgi:hypothetical protein
MTARRRKPTRNGSDWRWLYDGRQLAGTIQRLDGHCWRAIRVDPDTGRDESIRDFSTEAAALAFINNSDTA